MRGFLDFKKESSNLGIGQFGSWSCGIFVDFAGRIMFSIEVK